MNEPAAPADQMLHLGMLLGRRQAFSTIAGRCSAAEAASLRQVREEKSYRILCSEWGDFCDKHLGLSKSNANRIIAALDEFGPAFFHLSQFTRISPDVYRAIAPAVSDRELHTGDEPLELVPENADRIAAAVTAMRQAALRHPKSETHTGDPILCLVESCNKLVDDFIRLAGDPRHHEELSALLDALVTNLAQLDSQMVT